MIGVGVLVLGKEDGNFLHSRTGNRTLSTKKCQMTKNKAKRTSIALILL
jgi:hypothetical protein